MPRLRNEDIISYVTAARQEAEDLRKNLVEEWKDLENLYHNRYSFRDKEPWQFKVFPGQLRKVVKAATALLSRILLYSPNFVSIKSVSFPQDRELAAAVEEAVLYYFKRCNFLTVWREAVETALIYGLSAIKWGLQTQTDPLGRTYLQPSCAAIDPRDILFPYDQSFIIHRYYKTIPELKALAAAGVFDKGLATKMINREFSHADSDYEERLTRLGLNPADNRYRRLVCIDEFWGDIYDDNGEVIAKNYKVIIANERYVLSKIPNPYEAGFYPFVMISPIRVVGRPIGASIFDGVREHQMAMVRILNIMLDSVLFRVMPMFEVNTATIDDLDDLYSWAPGKFIAKRTDGQAITPIITQDIPAGAMNLYLMLRQEIQNATGVTDFVMGMPTVKGSPTATEVAEKTAAGQAYFEQIAKDIEHQSIVRSVELLADLITQMASMPTINWVLPRIFEKHQVQWEVLASDMAARLGVYNSWDVLPQGISLFFEKREALQALQEFLALMIKGGPQVMQFLNVPAVIERVMDLLHIHNPQELLNPEGMNQMAAPPANTIPAIEEPQTKTAIDLLQQLGANYVGLPEQ